MIINDTDLTREDLCWMLVMGTGSRWPPKIDWVFHTEHRHRGHATFRTLGTTWRAGVIDRDDGRQEAWVWQVHLEVKGGAQWRSGWNRVVTTKRGLTNTLESAQAEAKRWRKRLASEHRLDVEWVADNNTKAEGGE